MKTMTCRQLGGACDKEFKADTFEAMVEQSKKHGIEMVQSGEQAHMVAMKNAKEKMSDPKAMAAWIDYKRKEFDALPNI